MDHNSEHPVDDTQVLRLTTALSVASRTLLLAAFALGALQCSVAPPGPDNEQALADIAAHRAGTEEVVSGTVLSVFPESRGPSGVHERFLVDVRAGASRIPLYVTDNISVGQLAPLRPGDQVTVKGELAYNDRGPLLHWTHRDPRFRHAPGFVEVGGQLYE